MDGDDETGRRNILRAAGAVLAGAVAVDTARNSLRLPTTDDDRYRPDNDGHGDETTANNTATDDAYDPARLDPDDIVLQMEYLENNVSEPAPAYSLVVEYPGDGDYAEPGIALTGVYSVVLDEATETPTVADSTVTPADSYDNRLKTASTTYDELIADSDFAVPEITAETGDTLYGVFNMDSIHNMEDPVDDPINSGYVSELQEDETFLVDTPKTAVQEYLDG